MKRRYYLALAAIGSTVFFAGCSDSTGANLSRALDGTYYNESGSRIMSEWENGMKNDVNNVANDVKNGWDNMTDNMTNNNTSYGAKTDYETGKVPTVDAPYNQVTTGYNGYQTSTYNNMY